MSRRRLFLDEAPGETRGVVTLDGLPERLLIRRADDIPAQQLGARLVARVARIDRPLASAFLDMGEGPDAVLALSGEGVVRRLLASLMEGAAVEVEVAAEARRDKGALARLIGPAEGPVRLLQAAPGLAEQLTTFAQGAGVETGPPARAAADLAEAAALDVVHPLPGGGSIAIEPTRALTAVDVDRGAGRGETARGARRVNLAAVSETARLLRLKGLGGLVAIDLIGSGHDGAALAAAAKAAFAPDEPGVSIGPVSRFGLLQLVLPRRRRPVAERLCGEDGAPTPATLVLRGLRSLEREAAADRGARLLARCAPAVAAAARPYIEALSARIGARFEIRAVEGAAADHFEVSTL